jgi:hypothetical protein
LEGVEPGLNQMPVWGVAPNVPRTSKYLSATNSRISFSRSTSIANVGVCTLPTEKVSPSAIVYARDRFIPTSQSAWARPRAAAASESYARPSFIT